jgi:hypothetical protein
MGLNVWNPFRYSLALVPCGRSVPGRRQDVKHESHTQREVRTQEQEGMILVAHKATDASVLGMAQWLFSLVWMTDDKDGVRETWGKVENLSSQTRCEPNRIALHGAGMERGIVLGRVRDLIQRAGFG